MPIVEQFENGSVPGLQFLSTSPFVGWTWATVGFRRGGCEWDFDQSALHNGQCPSSRNSHFVRKLIALWILNQSQCNVFLWITRRSSIHAFVYCWQGWQCHGQIMKQMNCHFPLNLYGLFSVMNCTKPPSVFNSKLSSYSSASSVWSCSASAWAYSASSSVWRSASAWAAGSTGPKPSSAKSASY